VPIAPTNPLRTPKSLYINSLAAKQVVWRKVNLMLKLYYTPIALNSRRRARWHFWKMG